MKSISIDILRRIENYSENPNEKPVVGRTNENHVDDAWDDNKIYKGEVFLNLADKKVYTSDGKYIISLNGNKANYILSGLEVKKPPLSGTGIALDLRIDDGIALIDNKLCKFENASIDASSYKIDLTGTTLEKHKVCFLFAKPKDILDPNIQEDEFLELEFVQHIVEGTNLLANFDELYLDDYDASSDDILYKILYKFANEIGIDTYLNPSYLLIGVIYIPANYDENSLYALEPISLSNKATSSPIQEKSYKELLFHKLSHLSTFGAYKVFYKSQLVRDKNNLYIAHKTFATSSNSNIADYIILNIDDEPLESGTRFLSRINADYTDASLQTNGNEFWVKMVTTFDKPLDFINNNIYKYIVAQVPNLDPINGQDLETRDLPKVTVNGINLTVGFSNNSKDSAQVYFAKDTNGTFDINNYTLADLEALDFSGRNIREGYYLVWNESNIGYAFDSSKLEIIITYKL